MINILLIGLGPHARRIHFPVVGQLESKLHAQIVAAVDLESQRRTIDAYLRENQSDIKPLYLDKEVSRISHNSLTPALVKKLDKIVDANEATAVFICTEPIAHIAYAKWAMDRSLNVLMDKPISTPLNLATDDSSIEQLKEDYYTLLRLYEDKLKEGKKVVFELMTQRRYHPAFLKIKSLVDEISSTTGCPITSFQTTHCDGQWRMPSEIVDQDYHPYNQGYGKCSHSGYHSIDVIDWLVRSSYAQSNHKANTAEVISNFVYPNDFISQLPLDKYEKFFGSNDPIKYSENFLRSEYSTYGELDAQIGLTYHDDSNSKITIGQFNLLHNSFSQRNWPSAIGRDLYKGNGRIRHEFHYLVQGPFQTIIFESFQSEEILNEQTSHSGVGGEYHLDVHIFRNSKLFPTWKSYEKVTIDDLSTQILKGYSRGHQEDARKQAITAFLNAVDNRKEERLSDLKDQQGSIEILYGVYKSALLRKNNKNPIVRVKIGKRDEKQPKD